MFSWVRQQHNIPELNLICVVISLLGDSFIEIRFLVNVPKEFFIKNQERPLGKKIKARNMLREKADDRQHVEKSSCQG